MDRVRRGIGLAKTSNDPKPKSRPSCKLKFSQTRVCKPKTKPDQPQRCPSTTKTGLQPKSLSLLKLDFQAQAPAKFAKLGLKQKSLKAWKPKSSPGLRNRGHPCQILPCRARTRVRAQALGQTLPSLADPHPTLSIEIWIYRKLISRGEPTKLSLVNNAVLFRYFDIHSAIFRCLCVIILYFYSSNLNWISETFFSFSHLQ